MENNNPKDTTEEVVVENAEATPQPQEEASSTDNLGEEAPQEESSSTTEEKAEDLTALIEEEKSRGKPDPKKAKERFEKKRQQEVEVDDDDDYLDEDERPVTRKELQELLAQQAHQTVLQTQQSQINEISESLAESPQEAELIRSIHANRVFPEHMSLREQMSEAYAIANAKRIEARNAELTRTIRAQQTASRNTATTHRDPQAALEPNLSAELKQSMQRAGYTFNNKTNRYEKVLPNGKILVKENNKPPYLAD